MRVAVGALVLALAVGCGGGDEESAEEACAPYLPATTLVLGSSDIAECEPIDAQYTCDGEDVSPALSWTGVPPGTAELVLIVDDPDAPDGAFAHWLVYGLDPGTTELPEGVMPGGVGLLQGENDFGDAGYGGPCPPEGETHRYRFWLQAVDEETGLEPGATREDVLAAVEGHLVGDFMLIALYARAGG